MARLLYIQASPRKNRSRSTHVATEFLKSYWRSHHDDRIRTINVFHGELPVFDGLALQAKYNIMHGNDHSLEELDAWHAIEKVIAEFKDADKYLLSVPMWNFGIPYRLKQYLDIIAQPGYTFKANEDGYEGLVKGKPLLVIYSRGGAYPAGTPAEAVDLQKKYVELVFGFMGFENIQSIVVEPTLHGSPEDVEKVMEAAFEKARAMAETF